LEQDISTSDGDRQAHTEPTPDLATVLNVATVALNAAIVEDREFLDEAICLYAGMHVIQRVNTIFEVSRAAGLTIDWANKYPTYDLVLYVSTIRRKTQDSLIDTIRGHGYRLGRTPGPAV